LNSNGWRPDKPFVVVGTERQTQFIMSACPQALRLGLAPGMPLAKARAIYPAVKVAEADAAEDARALLRLAEWCVRFSPLVAVDAPDGLWIDAAGVAHLFGGEQKMLRKIIARLARDHISATVAIADTPGAAWAAARSGGGIIASGKTLEALKPLSVASLRLPPITVSALRRMGLRSIDQLLKVPRSVIPIRFGADVLKRLDQALGQHTEPINPILPPAAQRQVLRFEEPISTPDDLERATHILCERLCKDLDLTHQGARRLDLVFYRVDGVAAAIRVGTSRPNREPKHLAKMLIEKLVLVDPGFGVEAMALTAAVAERTTAQQLTTDAKSISAEEDLSYLTDRLVNRIGARNVYGIRPVESDIPERAVKHVPPISNAPREWADRGIRPLQLLSPPEPVDVIAMMPDHPPVTFKWRGTTHKIQRADGPERIQSEWWRSRSEITEVRDYFRVENERGERYWLYRDSRLTSSNAYRWYLHGVFA
jgi:protein ImuB